MKKIFITLLLVLAVHFAHASGIFYEGFEYANHDEQTPIGWNVDNETWLCGYLEKDHNRIAHSGNWYAYTNGAESWMLMDLNMSTQLQYRFSLWAISDGEFQLEIWAGNEASPNAMTQLMLNEIVSNGNYENISAYIEEVNDNYQYIGIHAVQSYCSDCILTIDDINIEMVDMYSMDVTPASIETNMAPGTEAMFKFRFINTGYESLTVYITPITEYFTDIHISANGVECTSFPAEPNEIVEISCVATMKPEITTGSLTWIDIRFWLDCGCATTMFTFWATAEMDAVEEHFSETNVYPNPSDGNVTIEGNGIATITNILGQVVLQKEIHDKEIVTLESGVYFIKINNTTRKVVIQ